MDLQAVVLEPGKAVTARMAAYLPNLLAAILILVVGWVLAKFARSLVFHFPLAVHLLLLTAASALALSPVSDLLIHVVL